MKYLFSTLLVLVSSTTWATEITPGNLVGKYKVEARAGFQKVLMNFSVLNTKEFELQVYNNDRADETCNGTYTMTRQKKFNGVFTCPSDRSSEIDFNIEFAGKTVENLVQGTTVPVTSSLAPGVRISAYVKKQ